MWKSVIDHYRKRPFAFSMLYTFGAGCIQTVLMELLSGVTQGVVCGTLFAATLALAGAITWAGRPQQSSTARDRHELR